MCNAGKNRRAQNIYIIKYVRNFFGYFEIVAENACIYFKFNIIYLSNAKEIYATVAQPVEQLIRNQQVTSSNLVSSSILSRFVIDKAALLLATDQGRNDVTRLTQSVTIAVPSGFALLTNLVSSSKKST